MQKKNKVENETKYLKFGDIVFMDFSPSKGHEQQGPRPAMVLSSPNPYSIMISVAPITSTARVFPLNVPLDSTTKTTGVILMNHHRSIDKVAREVRFIEHAPEHVLDQVRSILKAIYEDALE